MKNQNKSDEMIEQYLQLCKDMFERMVREDDWGWIEELEKEKETEQNSNYSKG